MIAFLSLNAAAPSRIRVAGAVQVRPWSKERLASIALAEPTWNTPPVVDSDIAWTTPFGE